MTLAVEVARWLGVSVTGALLLLVAWQGRKAIKAASRLATWAAIGLVFLVVLGVGALLGWWEINTETVLAHLSVVWDLLAGVGSYLGSHLL